MFPHSNEDHKTSSLGKHTVYVVLMGLPKPNPAPTYPGTAPSWPRMAEYLGDRSLSWQSQASLGILGDLSVCRGDRGGGEGGF